MKSKILLFIVHFWAIYLLKDLGECKKLKCKCSPLYCPKHVNLTCETDGNCFSQINIDEHTKEIEKHYGCLPEEPSGPVAIFHCKRGPTRKLEETNSVSCCYDRDFCNEELKPTLRTPQTQPSPARVTKTNKVIIALIISLSICFVIFIATVIWCCCRKENYETYRQINIKGRHIVSNQQTIHQLFEETGGSDFGLPKLIQRTIARQVQLTKLIHTGQFSRVYEALWRNDKVAVRLYPSRDEAVWLKECEFYDNMRRHDNILAFIASDRLGAPSATELYLITEYCPHGSLYDYLRSQHSLTKKDMLRLSSSIASGLAYLHNPITGTYRKCEIAHRNLTSKGIFVKKGGVCAIGHFALALKSASEFTEKEAEKNPKQPVKRYLAPELLDRSLVPGNCAHIALVKADVYSLGLVLWEIAFRTQSEGIQEPSQLPYQDMVSLNPSLEEMRKVVCVDRKRPPILNRWYRDEVMRRTSRVIEECWHHSPDARLTALRVQKTLTKLDELLTDEIEIQVV
ncbi:bone morphogenetic protein receptor type-1B-like [Dendronephthya gigantea]|uniref:bone morphogenetic protein receptor type-1B-like n=1 Tax=Dendronephthya gigantea TaxID=151771 RepID=UPI00106C90D7|nr:bone morphogenetic protein receptor type-1B-like [Dendronephthya gigantea]